MVRGLLRIRVGGVEGDRHAGRLEHLHVRERVADGRGALLHGPEPLYERRDADPLVGQVHNLLPFAGEVSFFICQEGHGGIFIETILVGDHLRSEIDASAANDALDPVVM